MHNQATLTRDLQALGIKLGRPVVTHSSLRSVGLVDGGANTVIAALFAAVGSEGSLLFPNLNIPHPFTREPPPRFDLRRDPVRQAIGALPQVFKEFHARAFSRHTTHSMMGSGRHCASLFAGHEEAGLPCGPGTPWWRLAGERGLILLLGVTQQCNTSIHGPEEVLTSYQLGSEPVEGTIIDEGVEISISSRLHLWGNSSDFNRINSRLEKAGGLRRGRIGNADSFLVDAAIFQAEVLAALREKSRFLLLD